MNIILNLNVPAEHGTYEAKSFRYDFFGSYGVPKKVPFCRHQHIADGYKHLQQSAKIFFGAYDPH